MKKKTLLWQLYPTYLIILVASLLVVSWYASASLKDFYFNRTSKDLHARAKLTENIISPYFVSRDISNISMLCKKLGAETETRITVIDVAGKVLGDSDEDWEKMEDHSDRPEIKQALMQNTVGVETRFSHTLRQNMMYVALPVKVDGKTIGVIRTSVSVSSIDKILRAIYFEIARDGIVVAIVAAVISLIISRRITDPLEQLKRGADSFAKGDFSHKINVPNTLEVSLLAEAMNKMASELDARIKTITEQKNELEAILSSMVEGVLAVDSNGHIISINKAASELLNVETEKARGRNIEEFIRYPQLQQFIKDTIISSAPTKADIFMSINQGRYFQLHGTSLLDGENGKTVVIVLNDITELRKLEKVRSDFVANVSHELKTPVTSIKGFVETLLDSPLDQPEQTKHFLEIIQRQSNRLNAIIEDLLSLSGLEEESEKRNIKLETQNLNSVIDEVVELASSKAEQSNVKLTIDCPEGAKGRINSDLLEQALLNLVNNAIKYSPQNSEVVIKVLTDDRYVAISVQDQGCGIEKKHLSRIFERFYVVDKARSRKLGGTGLGLSIVKHIALVHGGFVGVESTFGKGSTFTIQLPL